MKKNKYQVFLDFAEKLVLRASKILVKKRESVIIKTRKQFGDFTTDADYQVEKLIIGEIKKNFPNHNILSEEVGNIGNNNDYGWVIDPLDGTRNYQRGLPLYGTIITLDYQNKTVLTVFYLPETREIFKCSIDNGAYLNNKMIKCSNDNKLNEATLCMYYNRYNPQEEIIKIQNSLYTKLLQKVQLFNYSNSTSFDLYRLAQGCYEGVIRRGGNIKWWDVAGGILMVREGGGKVTTFRGKEVNFKNFQEGFIATNGKIHEQLLKIVNS